jgi:hypothetical protein
MSELFGVSPSGLRATSQHLSDVRDSMNEVGSSLRDQLNAEGAAWGDDRIGDQFAKGDGGFLDQLGGVDKSIGAKTGLLDFYADLLKAAADIIERDDQA